MRDLFGSGTKAVLAALCALAFPAAAAAVPPEPPLATSSNVSVVDHIPGSAAGMNFSDHYAYVSGWAGLTVLDISSPASPQLVGALPLPHFENEDVDLCGDTLIVVNDRESRDLGSIMYVVDIANRTRPEVIAVLPLGWTGGSERGSGHIANFVTADCSMLWVDGGARVEVVDLSNREEPRSLGKFDSAASHSPAFKVSHDTERDRTGTLWNVGGGGAAGYQLTDNPLAPELIATTGEPGVNKDFNGNNSPYNDFIMHNSQRRGDTLLITEEDYVETEGGEEVPGGCRGQGKFETWDLSRMKKGTITPQDTWKTELNGMLTGGSADSKAPVTANCSSHWFDARDGVAAVGWYEQGTRFLDYSDPENIRQVGYYIPANGSTWAAYWSPTDPTGQIVYTADAYRGVDVLRIAAGGKKGKKGKKAKTVRAPIMRSWFGRRGASASDFKAHRTFGFMCPVRKGAVSVTLR